METEQKSAADYQAVLADLESKRDELENAIGVIKRIMGIAHGASAPSPGHAKHPPALTLTPTSFFGMSVGDAAKKYLAIVKEPKTAPDIAKALQGHGVKTVAKNFNVTVFGALERKEDAGEVVRPKRGLWGLPEWYPGFRAKKANGEKKEGDQTKPTDSGQKAQADNKSKQFNAATFEEFVRTKSRRMKEVMDHFGVTKSAVEALLKSESKVHVVGLGWLKLRQ